MWLHLVMFSVVVVVHSNVGCSGKSSACWQAVGISAGWLAFEASPCVACLPAWLACWADFYMVCDGVSPVLGMGC